VEIPGPPPFQFPKGPAEMNRKTLSRSKRLAVALAAAILAAIGIVSCDQESACAAPMGIGAPRPAPAPAPRAPSFSKPSAPRPAPAPRPYRPSSPSSGGHSTTVVPVPVYVDNGSC
jgi:hypothetical protein